jgi:long-chain acyl-CoA synthetase
MFEQMGDSDPHVSGAAITYLQTLKPSAILAALHEEDIYAVIAVPPAPAEAPSSGNSPRSI